MLKFSSTDEFKWIDPKKYDSKKYSSNNSKGFVLEVDFEYPENHRNCLMIILQPQIKQKSIIP